MNSYQEEVLREKLKELGVTLVTPRDKLERYLNGLRPLIGRKGFEFAEAGQWISVGDQYRGMEEGLMARKAYESGLSALERAPRSTPEEKRDYETMKSILMQKLKEMS